MDSRSYRFIYAISANEEIPADFPKEIRDSAFESGAFLPQDDSNWHTPQFPARVLLLRDQSISIVSHPASGQQPIEIQFRDLLELETGYVLLVGWIRFTTRHGTYEITYNTRASRPLEHLLARLRSHWLRDDWPHSEASPAFFGSDLDLKFRNLLDFELGAGESVLLQYFQPPVMTERRHLFWKQVHWFPGNLLVFTSANRLLWINDNHRRHRELYAGISRSLPARIFQSCRVDSLRPDAQLAIQLEGAADWCVPVREATAEASAFSEVLIAHISGLRTAQAARNGYA